MEPTGVLIVAGGSGRRCGGQLPKQFRLLGGQPVLARTINLFAEALPGARIVVVLPAEYAAFWHDLAARFDVAAHTVAEGGAERFHSVRNGLAALPAETELIAVQDGVRPLASVGMIRRVAEAATAAGAAIPVVEPVDSFRETDGPDTPAAAAEDPQTPSHIVDRRRLRIVQTPQIFRAGLLRAAYEAPYDAAFTDDASVVERAGHAVRLVAGERTNLKLTTPEDFIVAEALLAAREESEKSEPDADRL